MTRVDHSGIVRQARRATPTARYIAIEGPTGVGKTTLAQAIARTTGYQGRLVWDRAKPDGTPRKLMDNSRLQALGWRASVGLEAGLAKMYDWFRATH